MIVARKYAALMTITLIVVRKNAALTFGVISSLLNGKCFDPVIDQGTFFNILPNIFYIKNTNFLSYPAPLVP